MSLATANAETKHQSLFARELTEEHVGKRVEFYYAGSHVNPIKRSGRLEQIGNGTITVEVNDSTSRFKTFVVSRIPHNGAIIVFN